MADLRSRLEAETVAHKTARERAEKAESQVSMTKLDLKTTREEASRLQQEVSGLQQKVGRGAEGGRQGGRRELDHYMYLHVQYVHCSSVFAATNSSD